MKYEILLIFRDRVTRLILMKILNDAYGNVWPLTYYKLDYHDDSVQNDFVISDLKSFESFFDAGRLIDKLIFFLLMSYTISNIQYHYILVINMTCCKYSLSM